MAIGKVGGLSLLACEKAIFGNDGPNEKCPVPAGRLVPWNAARDAANTLTDQYEAITGKPMVDVLSKKEKMLEQIDRNFRIELAFLVSLADVGGSQEKERETFSTFFVFLPTPGHGFLANSWSMILANSWSHTFGQLLIKALSGIC